MNNDGIILTLAYPETIVMVADEWYSPFLPYLGIGKKNYVRAGHAALVLIEKSSGILEYHDFGRYITPEPNGRVRGKDTDHELDFPLIAEIRDDQIINLEEILKFLATHPKFTHGDGTLFASVCKAVNYGKARSHINMMQELDFIRYAAFLDEACNCARFVTDSLIASVTDSKIRRRLKRSKLFTPSTIGNVIIADTEDQVYEVSDKGEISEFTSSRLRANARYFLDSLRNHQPNLIGTLHPKKVEGLSENAQWLSGIAAGAWFELHQTLSYEEFRFRRISPYGNVDVDGLYKLRDPLFEYELPYEFVHYSNCRFFHLRQNGNNFRFDFLKRF